MAFNLKKPPGLSSKHEAYPYQLDAVIAVKELCYAAIFHEQGLGKTKIAIDLVLYWLKDDLVDTTFIVTKKSLIQNWCNEITCHSYITPHVLSSNRRANSIAFNAPVLVYVMNYEVVSTNLDLMEHFLRTCRVGVVLDESQKIKNPESKLTKGFLSLSEQFERRVITTGTPVANRPYDVWSQICFLDGGKSLGESFDEFKSNLDLPEKELSISEYGKRLVDIISRIKPFSVRETKRTAELELPDKTIKTEMVALAPRQAEIYMSYRDQLAYELQIDEDIVVDEAEAILKRLLRLVQCASNPVLVDDGYSELPGKFQRLSTLLNELEMHTNKAIIWTGFIDNVEWLHDKLTQYTPEKVHGSLAIAERNRAIDRFKKDEECRLLIATPGAAKEGLTLTVANHAIFYDRSFSLDDYLQAQDRIHRISQTRPCVVHNLIARDSIDEWVDVLLNAKYKAAQLVQDDISADEFNREFANNLSDMLMRVLSPEQANATTKR